MTAAIRPLQSDSWYGTYGPLRRVVAEIEDTVRGRRKVVADRLECGHVVHHSGAPKAKRRHCSACVAMGEEEDDHAP